MSGSTLASAAPVRLGSGAGSVQWRVVGAALAASALLAVAIAGVAAGTVLALFGVGLALGVSLYHASFGFTSAFRVFLADGQGAGLRAQIVMLALACLLFFPALGAGSLFGAPIRGNVEPLNTSLVVGAFLFGVGMQLGGGCASGTLFAVGGGSSRMVLTLLFFIVGSVVGVAHLPFWAALPGLPAVSVVQSFGWLVALAGNLAVFGVLWLAVTAIERRRHGVLEPIARGGHMLRGPWPLVAGGVALAVLNFATLALAGRPWGITSAFGALGRQAAGAGRHRYRQLGRLGEPGAARGNRAAGAGRHHLGDGFRHHPGRLAGGGAGRTVRRRLRRIPMRQVVASVIGGLLLGYGARLAYGCNIGAFFSGVASGSLHGWVWVACALAGSYAGLKLRPMFGMTVERKLAAC